MVEEIVTVALAVAPRARVTLAGLNEAETPFGFDIVEKVTVPVNPLRLPTPTVAVTLVPALNLKVVGVAVKLKS